MSVPPIDHVAAELNPVVSLLPDGLKLRCYGDPAKVWVTRDFFSFVVLSTRGEAYTLARTGFGEFQPVAELDEPQKAAEQIAAQLGLSQWRVAPTPPRG